MAACPRAASISSYTRTRFTCRKMAVILFRASLRKAGGVFVVHSHTVPGPTIYTIGHSNHPLGDFMSLLKTHGIELLIDVRSRPKSRYRHFGGPQLESSLDVEHVAYEYMGRDLGGHPADDRYYNKRGRVVYQRIASESGFRRAVQVAILRAQECRVVLMCAEGDPSKCHRHTLLARELLVRGCSVQHVLRDGTLRDASRMFHVPVSLQLPLGMIKAGEDDSWESAKRIR